MQQPVPFLEYRALLDGLLCANTRLLRSVTPREDQDRPGGDDD